MGRCRQIHLLRREHCEKLSVRKFTFETEVRQCHHVTNSRPTIDLPKDRDPHTVASVFFIPRPSAIAPLPQNIQSSRETRYTPLIIQPPLLGGGCHIWAASPSRHPTKADVKPQSAPGQKCPHPLLQLQRNVCSLPTEQLADYFFTTLV